MVKILKWVLFIALVVVVCLPKETEISVTNKAGQRVALGMVGADKDPPTNSISLSYCVGFFLNPLTGAQIYLNAIKGLCVANQAGQPKAFNFEATKGDGEIFLNYEDGNGRKLQDIVRPAKDRGITITPSTRPQTSVFFKRVE